MGNYPGSVTDLATESRLPPSLLLDPFKPLDFFCPNCQLKKQLLGSDSLLNDTLATAIAQGLFHFIQELLQNFFIHAPKASLMTFLAGTSKFNCLSCSCRRYRDLSGLILNDKLKMLYLQNIIGLINYSVCGNILHILNHSQDLSKALACPLKKKILEI